MPGLILYGYNFYERLEYRLTSSTLINITNGRIKRLGKTKARLFEYLLAHVDSGCIYDENIIIDVFENHGLRCSKSYLLFIINELRIAFLSVGYDRDPIKRHNGNAWIIDKEFVQKIYVESSNPLDLINIHN